MAGKSRKVGYFMINGTKDNFKSEVLEAKGTVLVDFWAVWCGPCQMIAPILEEVIAERPEVKLVKVNVDEQMDLAREHRVVSIPTLLVYKDGELKKTAIGLQDKKTILSYLDA